MFVCGLLEAVGPVSKAIFTQADIEAIAKAKAAERERKRAEQEAEAQRAPADNVVKLNADAPRLLDEVKHLRSLVQHVAHELDELCLMAQHAQGQHGQIYGPLSERLAKLSVVLRDGLWPEEAA